uniref:Integrase, catalytic region, zinc finger, CCHC-type, peptidase aspartic, catalytic n=1 Tax=Tanacetum cinerariifolium TaxID=118510 RepID=A0A6L2LG06_TANCI|nr:hypothetical protein [Tanacetum cinerariifolium]
MNQVDMQGQQTLSYVGNWSTGLGAYTLFNNAIFQSDVIHSYDSDCDDLPLEQATLMANLSNHNSDVIFEVPTYNTCHDNNVFEQNIQEMQDCEQKAFFDDSNDEFISESNMISYEQYLKENGSKVVHITPSLTDFAKHFVPQQELSAEQAFWFQMSKPSTESSDPSPVKVNVPSELPKVSLVNASLKKLKSHLAKFNSVVNTRITPSALIEAYLIFFEEGLVHQSVQKCITSVWSLSSL